MTDGRTLVWEFRRTLALKALRTAKGSATEAAKALNIGRSNFYTWLRGKPIKEQTP